MSLRYIIGYSLLLFPRLVSRVLNPIWRLISLTEQFVLIVGTPKEIERYSRTDWNGWVQVRSYARQDNWLGKTEQALVERYFSQNGELLNLACGAGRETLLLARRGMRVTACDWSPRMITEGRRRAQQANLPVRFAVADLLYGLPYPEQAFDYLFLTNIAYSYVFPRWRRIRFLRQAHSVLKPGGIFIISFAAQRGDSNSHRRRLERLFISLRRRPPFNREYEPGDRFSGSFIHYFRREELAQEFEDAQFLVKEWLLDEGYAVLVKV